jgi:hypothetical protein
MIQINLIPDVKQELLRAQAQRNVVISASIILTIAAAAIVVLVASYVYGAQGLMMDGANKTIDKEYQKLSQVEDLDRLLTVQNQLTKVSELNANKNVASRLYGMLNVIVPTDSGHAVTISSLTVDPASSSTTEGGDSAGATTQGAKITIEGQTTGSYASLEVFEKTIAAAVIEYKLPKDKDPTGDLSCGDKEKQCRRLAVGGGDRSQAIQISEMSFGEDQSGSKTLRFVLSFTVVPELLSNIATDVSIKIGANGNVTDSYLNAPRAIFRDRAEDQGGQ